MAEAHIESLDAAQAEQARLKALVDAAPKAYQDNFMAGADQPPADDADAATAAAEPEGFRRWVVESRIGSGEAGATGAGVQRGVSMGQRLEYNRDTIDYGSVQLQLDVRHLSGGTAGSGGVLSGVASLGDASQATGARFTLRDAGLPLTTRVTADVALGDIRSEVTTGLSRSYRLLLGSTTVRGASVRVFDSAWDLRAGFGERGMLDGEPYPGFEKSQGTLAWFGATRRLGAKWLLSAQIDDARNIPASNVDPLTGVGAGAKSVVSWASSVAYGGEVRKDGDFNLRATLLGSHTASTAGGVTTGDAHGLSLEASLRTGLYRHEFGAYAGTPDLYFGDYAIATGTQNIYWRVDRSTSRLSWGGGIDYERAAVDASFSSIAYRRAGFSGNFQYLVDRSSSFGGSISMFRTGYDAAAMAGSRSLNANMFYQARFFGAPPSRVALTLRRNEQIVLDSDAATGQELRWEQDLIGGHYDSMRPEFTTTLGYARDQSGGIVRTYPTAGVRFRWWIDTGSNIGATLGYSSQSGGLYTSRGLSGSLTLEKELSHGWRWGISVSLNQARQALVAATLNGAQVYRSNDRSAFVYFRWDGSAGRPYSVAGTRSSDEAGAGSLAGQVYIDGNRDGEPQAGERGVANVEVVLDGGYRTTTDRDGRFEFPLVVTGRHQLTLTPETVPLPWGPAADTGVSIDVPLRGRATTAIAVIKVGD